jgi:hypothetical protein
MSNKTCTWFCGPLYCAHPLICSSTHHACMMTHSSCICRTPQIQQILCPVSRNTKTSPKKSKRYFVETTSHFHASSTPSTHTNRRRVLAVAALYITAVCTQAKSQSHTPKFSNPTCLVPNSYPQFHYIKRRFSIASKCRHMHEVLNIDEIKKLITQFYCTLRDEYFKHN